MSNKFNVGDKVMTGLDKEGDITSTISFDLYNESTLTGEVKELLLKGKVKVLWNDEYHNQKIFNSRTGRLEGYEAIEVNETDLIPFEEGQKKVAEIEAAFQKVEKEISEKVRIAGELLKQANTLASSVGAQLSQINSSYELLKVMHECGWRTSSMNC